MKKPPTEAALSLMYCERQLSTQAAVWASCGWWTAGIENPAGAGLECLFKFAYYG